MLIEISENAAIKLKEIMNVRDNYLVLNDMECKTCYGSGLQFHFSDDLDKSIKWVTGMSNGINWACPDTDQNRMDGTEIDFKKDQLGEYFEIYNQGHYLSLSPEAFLATSII